ncbi:MAG: alpha/beta hydrolase fold domain-containing protein, partial [Verrucomicrobiales bacterium]
SSSSTGGGWYKGSPESYTPMAQQLAASGFVTANIEYRLSGEAPFPAAIHDCKAAVRWLRANASEYGIDPDRIGAAGGSAGGHLCGLLATSGDVAELDGDGGNPTFSSAIQAAVIMAGAMDLTTPDMLARAESDPRRRLITFMGGTWDEARQNYIDASPIRHINAQTPPMCFMDGEFDRPGVRYVATREKLDTLGIQYEAHVIDKAPHPFWSANPFFKTALRHVDAFFSEQLGLPQAPGAE